ATTASAAALILIERDVPVEKIAPRVGGALETDGDREDPGQLLRPLGVPEKAHSGLLGRSTALPPIAGDAAGDDVRPVGMPPERARHHVIVGEVARVVLLTAVLAAVLIAREEVLAREAHLRPFPSDEAQEPHHRGHADLERDRADVPVVVPDDLDL